MGVRESRREEAAFLRAVLRDVKVGEGWQWGDLTDLIDVAVRRWTSFNRRAKPGKRTPENQIKDLLRGLRDAQGENIVYVEPGWLEHVAERFGAALLAVEQAPATPAMPDQSPAPPEDSSR